MSADGRISFRGRLGDASHTPLFYFFSHIPHAPCHPNLSVSFVQPADFYCFRWDEVRGATALIVTRNK